MTIDPFSQSEEYQRGYFDALNAAAKRDNDIIADSYKQSSDMPTIRIVDKVQANRGYLPGDYDNAMMPTDEPTKVCENLSENSDAMIDEEHENYNSVLESVQSKTSGVKDET